MALPVRRGPRPTTTPATPHVQLDQPVPAAVRAELWRRMTALPDVRTGRSGISLPDSRALHLDPGAARGPRASFLVGTEFAHLHGDDSGSLHLTLPAERASEAVAHGWAESHPSVALGLGPPTWIMVFGPRDGGELETVWSLVQESHAFGRGSAGRTTTEE